MSTTDQPRATTFSMRFLVWLGIGALAIVATVIAVLAAGHPEAVGPAVVGGGLGLVYTVLARVRATRRADVAGPAARIVARMGDERDHRIMEWALARTGYASLWTVGAAVVAAFLGADAGVVVAALFVTQLLVFAVSFGIALRRG
jgi:hypothetical protein